MARRSWRTGYDSRKDLRQSLYVVSLIAIISQTIKDCTVGVVNAAFKINPTKLQLLLNNLDEELSACSNSDLSELLAAGYISQHVFSAAISTRNASRLKTWAQSRMPDADLRPAFEAAFKDDLDMRKTPIGDYASIVTDYAFKGYAAGVASDRNG